MPVSAKIAIMSSAKSVPRTDSQEVSNNTKSGQHYCNLKMYIEGFRSASSRNSPTQESDRGGCFIFRTALICREYNLVKP